MRSLLLSSLALLPALALAQPDASSFPSCLAGLQKKAQAQGISADSYERFTSGLQADLSVLDLLDAQPEFTTPLWDYLAGLVDEQRVSDGKAMLAQHDKLLDQVAARYGVDKYTVVAVWGVESDYGRIFGKRPLLTSLSTLSCYGRRQSFFQGEFLATLKLLQAGDIRDAGITGSWAGAFGHTQFMPSTYARIAVDFDGDGRRDLVGSVALAIALLSDRLRGGSGLVASWPTDDPGISRLERKQLQKALLARGYDIGEADGLIGTSTRKAIQAEQKRLGLTPADGRAGRKILEALKGAQP